MPKASPAYGTLGHTSQEAAICITLIDSDSDPKRHIICMEMNVWLHSSYCGMRRNLRANGEAITHHNVVGDGQSEGVEAETKICICAEMEKLFDEVRFLIKGLQQCLVLSEQSESNYSYWWRGLKKGIAEGQA